MSRFFAFGCSFTINNSRPTWADIVGQQFAEYQNWARGGSGNQYIFNSLIECHQRNQFTSDDTVMIMWTSTTREDRYVKEQGGWVGQGSVYNPHQTLYPHDWVKKFACERGYLLRDCATITAVRDLLKSYGVTYKFLSMLPITHSKESNDESMFDKDNQDIIDLYANVLLEIKPSVYEIIFNSENWQKKKSNYLWVDSGVRDAHPDPQEALEYVQKVLPEIAIKQSTLDWIKSLDVYTSDIKLTFPKRF